MLVIIYSDVGLFLHVVQPTLSILFVQRSHGVTTVRKKHFLCITSTEPMPEALNHFLKELGGLCRETISILENVFWSKG